MLAASIADRLWSRRFHPTQGRVEDCGVSVTVDLRAMPSYLCATVTGEFVVDDIKTVLTRIVNGAYDQRTQNILIDCRGLTGDPSIRERFEVVAFVFQLRINAIFAGQRPKYRTAIVATAPAVHPNRYGVRQLVERKLNVTICERPEDALAWLGVVEADVAATG